MNNEKTAKHTLKVKNNIINIEYRQVIESCPEVTLTHMYAYIDINYTESFKLRGIFSSDDSSLDLQTTQLFSEILNFTVLDNSSVHISINDINSFFTAYIRKMMTKNINKILNS